MEVRPRCETTARYILPAVRYLVAKSLIDDYGFQQSKAAHALGMTQAAISLYVNSKRGQKWAKKLLETKAVRLSVKQTAKKIASSKGPERIDVDICRICDLVIPTQRGSTQV